MSDTPAEPGGPRAGPDERRVEPRTLLVNFLHLAVLAAFGIAQPLFDVLQREPEFFASRGSETVDIVAFALAVTLVPPVLLVLLELVAGLLDRRVAGLLHLVFVALLAAVVVMQLLGDVDGAPTSAVILGSLLLGAAVAFLYSRARGVRSFVTVLSPAPLLFLLIFLFISPVSKLTFASEAEARQGRVNTRAPIVMVGFDEFPLTSLLDRRGRIDAKRYPNFAAFARDATWFRNATGVHDRTTKAYPAILDGKSPGRSTLPIASDHPDNIFTLFGSSYRLNVAEQATRLCPEELCKHGGDQEGFGSRMKSLGEDLSVVYGRIALPRELADQLPSVSNTLGDFRGEGTVGGGAGTPPPAHIRRFEQSIVSAVKSGGRPAQFQNWVGRITAGARPSLNFNHVFFPHVPWQYLPSTRRYMKGPDEPIPGLAERTIRDEFVVRQGYQRHLLQLAFTDRLLGSLIDRLKRQRLYDGALIVLLADHGAAFRKDQDRRVVTHKNIEDLASVPLLIKAPGQQRGEVNDAYVRTVDIVPTIADILNIKLPWKFDGRSGFSEEVRRRRTVEMAQGEQATIGQGTGFKARVSTVEFERRQAAALRHKLALFGEGGDSLFRIGPNPELIGRSASQLSPRGRGPVRAEIALRAELGDVDPRGSDFVPALITGRIRGPGTPRKRDLAFAVNGRIVAVGESFSLLERRKEQFAAMVPESAFRRGANRVDVYEVTSRSTLTLLGTAGG